MTTRRFTMSVAFLLLFGLASDPRGIAAAAAPVEEEPPMCVSPPRRVVSLYPTASEVLAAIGAAGNVVGITIHDSNRPGLERTAMVGGFAQPDVERILSLRPDCVMASPLQEEAVRALRRENIPLLLMDSVTLAQGEADIGRIGKLMGKSGESRALIARQKEQLELAAAKVARLAADPAHRPVRVMRLMGFTRDGLMVPGDDSFQNELIRLAGGQAPVFGQKGQAITITPEQWRAFDPEFVYYCGHDPESVRQRLAAPPWNGVAALRAQRLVSYPCDLICRVASRYGQFCLLLSADLYGSQYARAERQVGDDAVLARRALQASFDLVEKAEILDSRLFDMPARTLLLRFTKPQTVLSSLTGWHEGIRVVGNHSSPPPSWPITHALGKKKTDARILALYGLDGKSSALLHTGADVANLADVERAWDGMRVRVLATAGVDGNAMRASVDTGAYVEPGTVNLIILGNRRLTPAAMTRAVIAATEAKTAAFQDLDIRSNYSAAAATGTGTDNVLVIEGDGPPATMAGGHTKLGELVARAAYDAVREAIARQNGLFPQRDIFRRLKEHGVRIEALPAQSPALPDKAAARNLALQLERTLLLPRYSGFMEGALAVSDRYERGLISNQDAFGLQCRAIAAELAGKEVDGLEQIFTDPHLPQALRQALNALATGILRR